MAKLFKLALESSDLEGAVASQEPAQPALDEAELEQNVEETTQEQAEIEQGEEEIDQALEEANGLVEQIEANDEKLENPDAVVTAADVEVSEEALKRACYSLGIPFQAKLSFASESVANDIRANARKYLATSNENLKHTLSKIIATIRRMISTLTNKISLYIDTMFLKSKNYINAIKTTTDEISILSNRIDERTGYKIIDFVTNALRRGPDYHDASKAAAEKFKKESAETRYALIENKIYIDGMDKISDRAKALQNVYRASVNLWQNIKGDYSEQAMALVEKEEKLIMDEAMFGCKPRKYSAGKDMTGGNLIGVSGKKGLMSNYTVENLEFEELPQDNKIRDFKELVEDVVRNKPLVLGILANPKAKLKPLFDIQKEIDKELASLDKKGDADQQFLNTKVMWLRQCSINACYFRMKEVISGIKAYKSVSEELLKIFKIRENRKPEATK